MSLAQNKQALFGSKSNGDASQKGSKTASAGSKKVEASPVSAAPAAPAPVSKTAGMKLSTPSSGFSSLSIEEKRKRMDEAREASEKGMNALKTSFFQWTPDHLSASTYFEKSANLYKQAGELKTAILMLLKAADSLEASGTLSAAAILCTKAGDWTKEKGNIPKAVEFYEKAAETWGLNGDLQNYGETLIKAARECESFDVSKAKALYFKGVGVLCPDDTPKHSLNQCHPIVVDIFNKLFAFLVKEKFYTDAIHIAERIVSISQAFELESTMCKVMASISVLQLTQGDVVKAQNTYLQEHLSNSQYIKSKECELIDMLIMACNQQDADLLDKVKMHPQLNYLDGEIQKLIKNLSLFGFEDDTESSAPVVPEPSKVSLFQTKKPAAAEKAQATPPPPPAPPVSAKVESAPEEESDTGSVDLDGLVIDDEGETDATFDAPTETVVQPPPPPPPAPKAAPAPVEEDEDELDLS